MFKLYVNTNAGWTLMGEFGTLAAAKKHARFWKARGYQRDEIDIKGENGSINFSL